MFAPILRYINFLLRRPLSIFPFLTENARTDKFWKMRTNILVWLFIGYNLAKSSSKSFQLILRFDLTAAKTNVELKTNVFKLRDIAKIGLYQQFDKHRSTSLYCITLNFISLFSFTYCLIIACPDFENFEIFKTTSKFIYPIFIINFHPNIFER